MAEDTTTGISGARRAYRHLRGLQELGVLIALIALCVSLSVTTDSFLTSLNLMQVARQASYYGIMAVGMVFVVSMGDIDLSVGSILTLTNIVTAMAMRDGVPVPVALIIGLATGAACGFANGLLSVWLRIPTIIVTLGTLSVYRGLALIFCKASPISQFPSGVKESAFFKLGGGSLAGVPTSVVMMLLVGALGWIVLTRTWYGRRIEAMGGNPIAARLSGIPMERYRIGVMTLNGMIAALAGIIALAFLESADPSTGQGFELWVIASVIIGGTALSGGQGSVPGAILGALIIAVIRNGLVLLGASAYAGTAVTGAVIILAVAIDSLVKRRTRAGL
jgi:ribose transport system permease protein